MMTHGVWICDNCERPTNLAQLIPLTMTMGEKKSKVFTFAFCGSCNNPAIHQSVLTKAAREFATWLKKNRPS